MFFDRQKKTIYAAILFLLSMVALAGCAGDAEEQPVPSSTTAVSTPIPTTNPPSTNPLPTETTQPPTPAAAGAETTASTPLPASPTAAPLPTATELVFGPIEPVGLALVAEGFAAPVDLAAAPGDDGRLFVVDQTGLISVVTAAGELLPEPFLDLRGRLAALNPGYDERGLLGMALHPDFAQNGRFFVYYSAPLRPGAPAGWDHTSHVSAFTVSPQNPNTADAGSERLIMQIDQPQSNHNGGQITFGPDGYLYIALGDGGSANDVGRGHVEDWYDANAGGNGQHRQNLLGAILRIDVDQAAADGRPYAIPANNPFAGSDGADEIFAYGFRNPYRISFDREGDRRLFAADAGQDRWEEVSLVTRGGNYGWNVKEGTHCFSTANPGQSLPDCPQAAPGDIPLIDPIIEYQNGKIQGGLGLAIVGGFVYRGSALPWLRGRYVFGDWSTSYALPGDGSLLVATPPEQAGQMWPMETLMVTTNESGELQAFLLSFGQDAAGELYVLTSQSVGPTGSSGKLYKIVPAG